MNELYMHAKQTQEKIYYLFQIHKMIQYQL
jgi:hypothetical protein